MVDTLENINANQQAASMGQYLIEEFQKQLSSNSHIVDIRGKGMMLGIQLDQPCGQLIAEAIEKGLLINVTAGSVIRLLPPLIMTKEEANELIDKLTRLITQFFKD